MMRTIRAVDPPWALSHIRLCDVHAFQASLPSGRDRRYDSSVRQQQQTPQTELDCPGATAEDT